LRERFLAASDVEMKNVSWALILTLSIAFYSFGGMAQEVEYVNGIRIIHNEKGGAWGSNPDVRLELVRTIGGLGADEHRSFHEPNDILRDRAGNIYILDSGNDRIQKFDPSGKYIMTIGRKGQGPGEFQGALYMDFDQGNNLFVMDTRARRIEIISSLGVPLKAIKFRDMTTARIRVFNNGLIIRSGLSSELLMNNRKKLPKLLEVMDQGWKMKLTFGEPSDYGDSNTSWFCNAFFFDTDAEDNICLSFQVQNRIEKYAPNGKLLWRADRPLSYTTDKIEKRATKISCSQAPKMNYVSAGIAVDGKGRIWVITYTRQMADEERAGGRPATTVSTGAGMIYRKAPAQPRVVKADAYKLEVFSPDGLFLGELPLAHHAHDIRIFDDNLFIREYYNAIFYQYKIAEME
jgi:hypothetical protein